MRIRLLPFVFLLFTAQSFAQREYNVWMFGTTGIDFNTGTATAYPMTSMVAREGASGICNENGMMLFYTNGGKSPTSSIVGGVWNRDHNLMPNGILDADDAGCVSTIQGTIVIPDPANVTKTQSDSYYILTVDCLESLASSEHMNKGLRYTRVDMGLDNGMGDVVEKGVQIVEIPWAGGASTDQEVVTALPHANGIDYWIFFAHKDSMGMVLLTENGFSAPFYQQIEPGWLTPSPANDHIMVDGTLYDFDDATGLLSNPILVTSAGSGCFSPDGKYLYKWNFSGFFQYDVYASDIVNSGVQITSSFTGNPFLAPDHRIYFVYLGDGNEVLSGRIECPNSAGLDCQYNAAYSLDVIGMAVGTPNYMQSVFYYAGNDCIAGLDDLEQNFLVYPNPSDGRIYFSTEAVNVTLQDAAGRIVFSGTVKGETDWTDLTSGIYYLRIENGLMQRLQIVR